MNLRRSRFSHAITLFVTLVLMLPVFAAVLTVAPIAVLAEGPATTGTAQASPWTEVKGPKPSATKPTLTAAQLAAVEKATEQANKPIAAVPDDPNAKPEPGTPKAKPTDPKKPGTPTIVKANDAVVFENSVLGAGAPDTNTSTTGEPSVASSGAVVFQTGNWYAAISSDGGLTFAFVDPFSLFPSVNGGFCCDQEVIYDPTRGIFIWELQYIEAANTNTIRIAVATPAQAVANNWFTFDLTPQQVGWNATTAYDYPNVALSTNNFYLSENVFINGATSSSNNTLMRIPLTNLANHTALNYGFFNGGAGQVMVQGATTTMYFATHGTTSSLNLYTWPEGSSTPTGPVSVAHSMYVTSTHTCTSPDGTDACARDDTRIKTGWVANGIIGFMWDVGQGAGGLGTFPYPYVHVVRINAATMTMIDQPVIYSPSTAYGWPGVGINNRGAIGGSIMFGGGSFSPGNALFIQDDFTTGAWDFLFVTAGTNGPGKNRWGDYFVARPADGNGSTWVATGYTEQGPCTDTISSQCANVVPRYYRFGRQRDNPFAGKEALPGIVRGGGWYLANNLPPSGPLAYLFGYGAATGQQYLLCDWRGNGQKTPAVFVNGVFYISYGYTGTVDLVVPYGAPGDIGVCGDWNGTGFQKVGIFRNGLWALSFSNTSPAVNISTFYGGAGQIPVVGDWNGTGVQKIGVFQSGVWALSYSNTSPALNVNTYFGAPGQTPVVGDWNRSGSDKLGVYQGGTWALSYSNTSPALNLIFGFGGAAGDVPVVSR